MDEINPSNLNVVNEVYSESAEESAEKLLTDDDKPESIEEV